MPGKISTYTIQNILNPILDGTTFGSLYLALFNANGEEMAQSKGDNIDTGYRRVLISGVFPEISGDAVSTSNSSVISFPKALTDWGSESNPSLPITQWKIFNIWVDNVIETSDSQEIMSGEFDRSVEIKMGDIFTIPMNGLSIGIDSDAISNQ